VVINSERECGVRIGEESLEKVDKNQSFFYPAQFSTCFCESNLPKAQQIKR